MTKQEEEFQNGLRDVERQMRHELDNQPRKMTLSEELQEASVAATGHHADLLRRAAEYVAACENQKPYTWTNEFGSVIESWEDEKDKVYPLYLHPSPPAEMQITEDDVRMILSVGHYMTTRDESPRCGGDLFGLARRIEAMLKAMQGANKTRQPSE